MRRYLDALSEKGLFLFVALLSFSTTFAQVDENMETFVFIRKAEGLLTIEHVPETEPYDVYFNIPISFGPQVPIYFSFDSPNMIDYRFIELEEPNLVMCARLVEKDTTHLYWTAWVLIGTDSYSEIPEFVPFPDTATLPQEVKKWLKPSDLVQSNHPMIIDTALAIKGNDANLMSVADKIANYCGSIGATWAHTPICFDAFYTLNWGNSCTGHAHLAAALFRALGIPARCMQCIPVWYDGYMDMHWMIDYYVPDYGWVKLESTLGNNKVDSRTAVVPLVSNPEDEFPLYFIGIDGHWHTSDPALTMFEPTWGVSHRAYSEGFIATPDSAYTGLLALANNIFDYYTATAGIIKSDYEDSLIAQALHNQEMAMLSVTSQLGYVKNYDSLVKYLDLAMGYYEQYAIRPMITIYEDDFESGNFWFHGGEKDEWEWGTPAYGNIAAHSGDHCYATDLNNTYENYADNWLETPEIDLTGLSCAYFSFWVWNDVHDCFQGCAYDPLWMEITTDQGASYIPYSSHMAGASDDPVIPKVGGWSRVVHDLTPYCGETVKIRYRFTSDGHTVYAGSYIDDVSVYGREFIPTSIPDQNFTVDQNMELTVFPNPCSVATHLRYSIFDIRYLIFELYSIDGKKLMTIKEGIQQPGENELSFDVSDLPAGLYFLSVKAGDEHIVEKIMVMH